MFSRGTPQISNMLCTILPFVLFVSCLPWRFGVCVVVVAAVCLFVCLFSFLPDAFHDALECAFLLLLLLFLFPPPPTFFFFSFSFLLLCFVFCLMPSVTLWSVRYCCFFCFFWGGVAWCLPCLESPQPAWPATGHRARRNEGLPLLGKQSYQRFSLLF